MQTDPCLAALTIYGRTMWRRPDETHRRRSLANNERHHRAARVEPVGWLAGRPADRPTGRLDHSIIIYIDYRPARGLARHKFAERAAQTMSESCRQLFSCRKPDCCPLRCFALGTASCDWASFSIKPACRAGRAIPHAARPAEKQDNRSIGHSNGRIIKRSACAASAKRQATTLVPPTMCANKVCRPAACPSVWREACGTGERQLFKWTNRHTDAQTHRRTDTLTRAREGTSKPRGRRFRMIGLAIRGSIEHARADCTPIVFHWPAASARLAARGERCRSSATIGAHYGKLFARSVCTIWPGVRRQQSPARVPIVSLQRPPTCRWLRDAPSRLAGTLPRLPPPPPMMFPHRLSCRPANQIAPAALSRPAGLAKVGSPLLARRPVSRPAGSNLAPLMRD